MTLLWPQNLWWLLLLPMLPVLYLWLLRRRRTPAIRLSSIANARQAAGAAWRRHIPPALNFVALALLVLAWARPVAQVTLPWTKSIIMLAIDVSLSMRVEDVQPSRMVAAQQAARSFLRELPRDIDVGIVTFAGTAQVAQQTTRDRESLLGAIDAVQMQRGTAIGSAIVVCLAELFPDHGIDLSEMIFGDMRMERQRNASPDSLKPVAPGSYKPAAIILLTDGRRTTGVDTLRAAQMAADRGVRVHVVGLGTPDGHLTAGEGMSYYLQLDEATLREVARMTGGDYHQAATAEALRSVYLQLGSKLQVETRETEVTALLALLAALLISCAALLSVWWHGRIA